MKGQAVVDLLANFPRTSDFSVPQQEVLVTEEKEWSMHFDGSSTSQGRWDRSSVVVTMGGTHVCLQNKFPLFKK